MKDGFPLFASCFESKKRCFAILMLDLSDNLSASLRDIMFVALLFMLHVPLDSIIESVIAFGGVLLWVSSVSWDTQ